MSNYILTQAWDADCKPTEKFVLVALADQANDDGVCWPSVSSIEKRTGFSERAVRNAIQSLSKKGYLTVKKRQGRSTIFVVHPGTSCTPALDAPLHEMHLTPAPPAGNPGTSCTHNHKEPSINPKESVAGKKSPQITFATFLKNCAAKDELPIREDDPIFDYANKAGIPAETLQAHWLRFREKYEGEAKTYADWRATFRNSVKGNWFKFWYVAPDGTVEDTTHLRQFIAASGVTA